MLGHDVGHVHRRRVGWQSLRQRDTRCRQASISFGQAGVRPALVDRLPPPGDVHNLNRDRTLGARVHARRGLADREAAVAHVTFADYAALGVVLRHAVRTVPRAVLTADTGVGAVLHDTGRGILRVGINGAALQARRLEAVIASHREIGARGDREPPTLDLFHASPIDRRGIVVLLVAGDDAAFAADALP